MIREERNPDFWDVIAHHPQVAKAALLGVPMSLADIVRHESVTPLAAEHGGYLFVRLDGLGRVYELHSLFTPEGWGREAMLAAVQAFNRMFQAGMQVLTTYEVQSNPHSRPPRGFGFEPAGDFTPALGHVLRTWTLTQTRWEERPSRLGIN